VTALTAAQPKAASERGQLAETLDAAHEEIRSVRTDVNEVRTDVADVRSELDEVWSDESEVETDVSTSSAVSERSGRTSTTSRHSLAGTTNWRRGWPTSRRRSLRPTPRSNRFATLRRWSSRRSIPRSRCSGLTWPNSARS
jgi:septal ring factor EnvC (AmiA/AmiB activator)